MRRTALLASFLVGFLPGGAEAQFFGPLEDFFSRVDALTISGVVGGLVSADRLSMDEFVASIEALRGIQVKILIDVTPEPDAASPGDGGGSDPAPSPQGDGPGDAAAVASGGSPGPARRWEVELGLGADYLTGFTADEPSLDLRGSIRGLPTLSAYATPPLAWGSFQPYLGVNTGFTQLWNVKGFDEEGRQYGLDGQTFQLGAALGLYHAAGFFLELSYRNRNFRSVEWEFPAGIDALPGNWPRALDLSALLLSLGFQFGRIGG